MNSSEVFYSYTFARPAKWWPWYNIETRTFSRNIMVDINAMLLKE